MTNEKLAQAIQAGDRDRLPELWGQVQGLAKYWANRYTRSVVVSGGDTNSRELFDDLFQCGYIALVAAVDSFDSAAGGAFSTWYAYYFRQEVYSLMGWRSAPDPKTGEYTTIRRDALNHASSLDTPLGDEADSGCLGDIIPDPDSRQGFEEAEKLIWNEELHTALETALGPSRRTRAAHCAGASMRARPWPRLPQQMGPAPPTCAAGSPRGFAHCDGPKPRGSCVGSLSSTPRIGPASASRHSIPRRLVPSRWRCCGGKSLAKNMF